MKSSVFVAFVFAIGMAMFSMPANAQASRTWVSGVGDDANPCSRTAPCKTFAGSISNTSTGGEINCLDPGGFGALTITKSITINCEETLGSVLVSGTNGIVISAPAGSVVTLKGLEFEGLLTGLNAISFVSGTELHVHKFQIRDFTQSGISVTTNTAGSRVYIADGYISNCAGSSGAGIFISPTAGDNTEINHVQIESCSTGINAAANASPLNVSVRDSVVANGTGNGIHLGSTGGAATMMVDHSTVTAFNGVGVTASAGTLRIGNSTITANVTGVSATGTGTLRTYKTNQINGNATDGTPITNQDGLN
jgi:hypothetical protein